MAFITFLAHKKSVGIYHLNGPTTLGRSLDCDIYVPDVFVSRQHCRFENHEGLWRVVDLESSNGIWHEGRRTRGFVLKPGDTFEIGTVALVFNEGTPEEAANPAPFGMGLGVTELMDTVCTKGIRPWLYSKKQSVRKDRWLARERNRLTHVEEENDTPAVDQESWRRDEWAELDIETTIAAGQEAMTDWAPPIFNPKRKAAGPEAPASGVPAADRPVGWGRAAKAWDQDTPEFTLGVGAALAKTGNAVRKDSIDEEVSWHAGEKSARPRLKRGVSRRSFLAAATSWLPFVGKAKSHSVDGIVFEEETWRDRLAENVQDRWTTAMGYAKLNPALAAAVVLGGAVIVGAVLKFSPVGGRSGPHLYIPPEAEAGPAVTTASK